MFLSRLAFTIGLCNSRTLSFKESAPGPSKIVRSSYESPQLRLRQCPKKIVRIVPQKKNSTFFRSRNFLHHRIFFNESQSSDRLKIKNVAEVERSLSKMTTWRHHRHRRCRRRPTSCWSGTAPERRTPRFRKWWLCDPCCCRSPGPRSWKSESWLRWVVWNLDGCLIIIKTSNKSKAKRRPMNWTTSLPRSAQPH